VLFLPLARLLRRPLLGLSTGLFGEFGLPLLEALSFGRNRPFGRLFVENGLMREGEPERVAALFRKFGVSVENSRCAKRVF
jgi:GMP synthase PP-ATPase subunit